MIRGLRREYDAVDGPDRGAKRSPLLRCERALEAVLALDERVQGR